MNIIYGIRSGFDIRSFCDDRWPEEHKRKQDQDDQENVCQSPSEIEAVLFIISPGFQDFDRDYAGFHIACGKYIIQQLVRCLCIQFRNVCMFCVVQRRIIRMKYKGGVFIQTNRLPSYFSAVSQVVFCLLQVDV